MRDGALAIGSVGAMVLLSLVVWAVAFGLFAATGFFVWNFLVVWAFPSLPLVTWGQAAVVAFVLGLLSSYGGPRRAK